VAYLERNNDPDDSCGAYPLPILELQDADRRQAIRLQPEVLSAILYIGEERRVVSIGDISSSGAKVVNAPDELAQGVRFELAACPDGRDKLKVECEVVYVRGSAIERVAGVKFTKVEEEETRVLVSYLQSLLKRSVDNAGEAIVP
jgi:c-di-GMP-binding flagellar brake protein YcgR